LKKNSQKRYNHIPFMNEIIQIIVSLAKPDQIILFGSYARGDNTKGSDIDLLILKKGLKKPSALADSIRFAFYENKIDVSVDVLALDADRYSELSNQIGLIYKTIKKEGKKVYAAV
jgi:predicted nucleotidyltransferase